jgi:hypothetical protein
LLPLQISNEGAAALAKLVECTPTLLLVNLDNNPSISEDARATVRKAPLLAPFLCLKTITLPR